MSIEAQILKDKVTQLRKAEAALKKIVLINSVNDFISLMYRYKKYLIQFNRIGNAVGRMLLRNDYSHLSLDKLNIKLYLDSSAYSVVFENHSALTDYLSNSDSFSVNELIEMYCHPQYESLKADFKTPVAIADKVRHQLPNSLFCSHSTCNIDGIIEKLMSIRSGKVDRLVAEFS
ncbi:hypothetical protein [Pontibacter virosus]|uniref:Uncharacterized protein n=1 Tax=Pontibacter virosus TaxID=1765052 RepID=A0A2U1B2J9_9BACT|nr:hypothetical protein [Pontibacter virosus]PVY42832.1 hypothetical protein C8E01_1025 [Pontibacter virosus]